MFYGIIIYMYFLDIKKHNLPHIHAKYQDSEAIIDISSGSIIDGTLPPTKLKLVLAWVEIHKEELAANWQLAVSGQKPFQIQPLH